MSSGHDNISCRTRDETILVLVPVGAGVCVMERTYARPLSRLCASREAHARAIYNVKEHTAITIARN